MEIAELVRVSNEKYQNMLLEQLNKQDGIKSEFEKYNLIIFFPSLFQSVYPEYQTSRVRKEGAICQIKIRIGNRGGSGARKVEC